MSVSVRIPTILRTYTHGESEVNADGSTLSEVLESLDSSYPGIKARILDDQGSIRRFVNVYVGNDDVRFLEALDTSTPEGTRGPGSRPSREARPGECSRRARPTRTTTSAVAGPRREPGR